MAKTTQAKRRRVTFRMAGEAGSEICVAGTFNDWSPTADKLSYRNGAYTASVLLAPGRYEYKLVVNGVWCIDPECPDWVPNGLGSLNSVMMVE